MNRRQAKKEYKKPLSTDIRFLCPIWKCNSGEPCSACDGYFPVLAKRTFRKMLKREGLYISGWRLAEIPTSGVYIFYNDKKNKEITLETDNNKSYIISVFDSHLSGNIEYNCMSEALKSHLQNFFYDPEVHKYSTRKARKQRIKEKLFS